MSKGMINHIWSQRQYIIHQFFASMIWQTIRMPILCCIFEAIIAACGSILIPKYISNPYKLLNSASYLTDSNFPHDGACLLLL